MPALVKWEAARWFLAADGESGKRYGNETIRVTPDGEVSIKLPAPLAHLANGRHGRYVLSRTVVFRHRGEERADRAAANRAGRHGLSIAIEDLGFQAEKTREKHGRRKRFRELISGMPVAGLRARLVSMGPPSWDHHRRRGPGLRLRVGRAALAQVPHHEDPQDHPSRRGERRERTARPWAPHPGT